MLVVFIVSRYDLSRQSSASTWMLCHIVCDSTCIANLAPSHIFTRVLAIFAALQSTDNTGFVFARLAPTPATALHPAVMDHVSSPTSFRTRRAALTIVSERLSKGRFPDHNTPRGIHNPGNWFVVDAVALPRFWEEGLR